MRTATRTPVAQGWTVTASTGRFGFGARTYRDPRFDSLRRQGCRDGSARIAEPPGHSVRPGRMSPIPVTRKAAR